MGRGGAGGAIVRRQSIASISSANCADVSVSVPSTIGGHTNLLRCVPGMLNSSEVKVLYPT
jgi:hypothetical protein